MPGLGQVKVSVVQESDGTFVLIRILVNVNEPLSIEPKLGREKKESLGVDDNLGETEDLNIKTRRLGRGTQQRPKDRK